MEGLERARALVVQVGELLVEALEGAELAVSGQGAEDVDDREVVRHEAARCDLDGTLGGSSDEFAKGLGAERQIEEGLGLDEEGAMVADGVDDGELLFRCRLAQAPTELLQPEDARLGWGGA